MLPFFTPIDGAVIIDPLAAAVRRAGGRTVRNGWLVRRLERQRLSAPSPGRPGLVPSQASSIGQGTPGSQAGQGPVDPDAAEAPRWSPGRNATRKRGNGRRRPAGER